MDAFINSLGPWAFPLLFPVFWCGLVWFIGWMSGWHALANRYPDRPETALTQFNWRSGRFGPLQARYNGVLHIGVCPSGLRLSLMFLFAIGNRPLLVPWDQISVKRIEGTFTNEAQLTFGRPEVGTLTIWQSLADEIAKAAPKGRWPG